MLAAVGAAALIAAHSRPAGAPARVDSSGAAAGSVTACSARQRPRQARHLPAVRQHALQRGDNPNVASDLEQMPHLLNFLKSNGTLFTNDHTILISHTAGGILTLAHRPLPATGTARPCRTATTSTRRATIPVVHELVQVLDERPVGPDERPAAEHDHGHGQDHAGAVGAVHAGRLRRRRRRDREHRAREHRRRRDRRHRRSVFGPARRSGTRPLAEPAAGQTDFVGIAIHCAQVVDAASARAIRTRSPICSRTSRAATPASTRCSARSTSIRRSPAARPCVERHARRSRSRIRSATAASRASTGCSRRTRSAYVAQMQESGVPVTYGYISDVHDLHVPNLARRLVLAARPPVRARSRYEQQLQAYDDAFASFFQRARSARDHTEQHAVRRSPSTRATTSPAASARRSPAAWLVYDHRPCTNLSSVPDEPDRRGEREHQGPAPGRRAGLRHPLRRRTGVLRERPAGRDRPDRAQARAGRRQRCSSLDPYSATRRARCRSVPLTQALADTVEEKALHMVNADPNRTPTFTMFGNPDFFFRRRTRARECRVCVNPGFAWNHGDIQQEIGNTWVGIVGPGIAARRHRLDDVDGSHEPAADDAVAARPEGRLRRRRARARRRRSTSRHSRARSAARTCAQLADAYEQVNASFGAFATDTLKASTTALESTDDTHVHVDSRTRSRA